MCWQRYEQICMTACQRYTGTKEHSNLKMYEVQSMCHACEACASLKSSSSFSHIFNKVSTRFLRCRPTFCKHKSHKRPQAQQRREHTKNNQSHTSLMHTLQWNLFWHKIYNKSDLRNIKKSGRKEVHMEGEEWFWSSQMMNHAIISVPGKQVGDNFPQLYP